MKQKLGIPDEKAEPNIEKSFWNFVIYDNLLVWKGSGHLRSYVPNSENFRKELIAQFHQSAHLGTAKIVADAAQYI